MIAQIRHLVYGSDRAEPGRAVFAQIGVSYPDWQREPGVIRWNQLAKRVRSPPTTRLGLPHYYASQNFHGIEKGYLNPVAAITYDAVSAFQNLCGWVHRGLDEPSWIRARATASYGMDSSNDKRY